MNNTISCSYAKKCLLVVCSLLPLMSGAVFAMDQGSSVAELGRLSRSFAQGDLPHSFWGRLSGPLGSGVAGLGKAFCWGVNAAATGGFKAAKFLSDPNMLKVEAGLAGIGATYGVFKAIINRARLYEKREQSGIERVPTGWSWLLWAASRMGNDALSSGSGKVKIYNWRLRELRFGRPGPSFPTASTILSDEERALVPVGLQQGGQNQYQHRVLEQLFQDVAFIDISNNAPATDPRRQMLDTISAGISELRGKLNELIPFACFPSRRYDRIGIEKIINDCCKEYVRTMAHAPATEEDVERAAADMRSAFETNGLSYQEELELDRLVKNAIKTTLKHWLTLRPNFDLAATIYWELLKRIKRLEALKGIVVRYYAMPVR